MHRKAVYPPDRCFPVTCLDIEDANMYDAAYRI